MIYVLILTHNRLDQVQKCFASLIHTACRKDVAITVLDNASTDGTAEYVSGTTWGAMLSKVNHGVAEGRKRLLDSWQYRLKSDDLVVFLDSDTVIVDDNWLDVLAKAIEPENVGVVGPGGSFVLPEWAGFTAGAPGEVDCVAGYCTMFKAELLMQGLAMDTSFERFWSEDSDFNFQVRAMGYDVLCVPVGVAHYPSHSGYGQDMSLHDANFAKLRNKWQGKHIVKIEGGY